mmetsp:Transcript_2284/g.8170  ORF Transcript_2284/g.8170 Transcript_2284/m.8170 type:complete len:207 (+) Transcript_2284:234-854(+)
MLHASRLVRQQYVQGWAHLVQSAYYAWGGGTSPFFFIFFSFFLPIVFLPGAFFFFIASSASKPVNSRDGEPGAGDGFQPASIPATNSTSDMSSFTCIWSRATVIFPELPTPTTVPTFPIFVHFTSSPTRTTPSLLSRSSVTLDISAATRAAAVADFLPRAPDRIAEFIRALALPAKVLTSESRDRHASAFIWSFDPLISSISISSL